jgi:rhomboid protease GluP
MNLNTFFIQLVLFWGGITLLRSRRTPRGWLVVAGIILAVLAGTYLLIPAVAGLVSGSLWLVLVAVPLIGFAQVNRLTSQENYRLARQVAEIVKWLHPADGFVEFAKMLQGLELAQHGKMEPAIALLNQYQSSKTASGRMATALFYRLTARWDEYIRWTHNHGSEKVIFGDPTVTVYYLRSLGEIGDLNGLLEGVEQLQRRTKASDARTLNLCRMFAFAFCGKTAQVNRMFDGVLAVYPQNMRDFWVATARLAEGTSTTAREQLLMLREGSDVALQNAIDWRLSQPRIDPKQLLSPTSEQILAQIEATLAQEARYDIRTVLTGKIAPATCVLIAINAIVFGVEVWAGGAEDSETLFRLGGLVPEVVVAGQWWRLVSAMFLHAGLLHLALNMLGFYYLGTFVEAVLGIPKFLIAYFFCGIGSMGILTAKAVFTGSLGELSVGASGAILGLIGVVGAISLKGWRHENAKVAAKQFRWVLFCVGLQAAFDLVTPQVSFLGHLSGAALGFLVGLVLFNPRQKPRFT